MDMPKRSTRLYILIVAAIVLAPLLGADSLAQDIQPLAPALEPNDREQPEDGVETPGFDEPELIPLPEARNRTTAALRDRVRVTTVLPASWSGVVANYQPLWIGILSPSGFGLHQWTPYFASSGLAPVLTAHPFFGPWGVLSYDGWILDRYRQVWTSANPPGRLADAGHWLQLGDRAMAERSAREAAEAYRQVTQAAPDFPLGYVGLGAALAELGDDAGAAQAFRQSLDRYPAWLALAVDWSLFYGRQDRLETVQAAADQRAESGSANSQFVAGVLHMFGDHPGLGREILSGLEDDPHAVHLMTRGPR
jgi:tetratricopeptide (TPR) repeat protein